MEMDRITQVRYVLVRYEDNSGFPLDIVLEHQLCGIEKSEIGLNKLVYVKKNEDFKKAIIIFACGSKTEIIAKATQIKERLLNKYRLKTTIDRLLTENNIDRASGIQTGPSPHENFTAEYKQRMKVKWRKLFRYATYLNNEILLLTKELYPCKKITDGPIMDSLKALQELTTNEIANFFDTDDAESEEYTKSNKEVKNKRREKEPESSFEEENERQEEESDDLSELVKIGPGNTKVPRHVLEEIDWHSHTNATRRLLMTTFPRSMLCTHSMTGKGSPAHTNVPAKKSLDPVIINDIVHIVKKRCNVTTAVVRQAITTKLADEHKMKRTRDKKTEELKRKRIRSKENKWPSTSSTSS